VFLTALNKCQLIVAVRVQRLVEVVTSWGELSILIQFNSIQ
jgi:hypothetical protein